MFKLLLIILLCFYFKIPFAQEVLTFKNQQNLIPEGIAIDDKTGHIYISSIAQKKIIRIADGIASDFILRQQDGFEEGLGMKIDHKQNILWALSNTRKGTAFTSRIHGFDLTSGKTVHQFKITDSIPRLFNDLVISTSGVLIITDTYYSAVYTYKPAKKKLDILFRDTTALKWPNGIDWLDDKHIIVATYGNGLMRINLPSKKVSPVRGYTDKSIAFGLDGLVVTGNNLYGVYNAGTGGQGSNAIIKYTLDDRKEQIVSETVTDKGNPAFADPTTAARFRNKLFVIANSYLDQYNANKESTTGIENKLTPLTLVVYAL